MSNKVYCKDCTYCYVHVTPTTRGPAYCHAPSTWHSYENPTKGIVHYSNTECDERNHSFNCEEFKHKNTVGIRGFFNRLKKSFLNIFNPKQTIE